jgi:four helix bundle protein
MNYIYSFEKLEVWQKSRVLVKYIYQLTREYPDDERFGLISQMRRCTISIASNLAEGTARKTMKDKAHFTTMAYGSSLELLNQLILSLDLGLINEDKYLELRTLIEEVTNKLNSLRNSQLNQ